MASTRGYVNIKTFEQKLDGNKKIEGKEISVAFPLYSDVHKISGAHYQIFPSEKAAYSTVYEENQRTDWITANEDLWKVTGE
ncbi:virion structural protein [Escherichia phage vB_EcoM_Lutter]|uniref:Small outer capsid protein n=1 Tax=Escherichia phage vB_EcoM_Lutter TaxID=2750850 RepID=A0A7D5FRH6_9CAUD|nr:virion structural protein [Escherichia phage vB_EcoM_Lutter]QLF82310.1 capsid and scaffold protein [Escherichia phage vB_EcoM_Lutter]